MSPTLPFPFPFRSRDLPPYGHADWKRLQPALLRRSLTISSALALTAGLLLAVFLREAVEKVAKEERTVYLPPGSPPPDGPRNWTERNNPVVKSPDDGTIVAGDTTHVDVDDFVLPAMPGVIGPSGNTSVTIPGGNEGGGGGPAYPDRPDPKEVTIVDELPVAVSSPKPEYPTIAQASGMEGTVVLKVLVTREGRVAEVIVERSSPIFDEAAERTIRQWRFRPAILANQPVPAWVVIPVRFVLHE